MPTCTPNHNPIEHVWREAKTRISRLQRDKFSRARTAFETSITARVFHFRTQESVLLSRYPWSSRLASHVSRVTTGATGEHLHLPRWKSLPDESLRLIT